MPASFIKSPFKDQIYKEKSGSDYEGAVYAGGDIKVAGKDVVVAGPQIGDAPDDLTGWLKSL